MSLTTLGHAVLAGLVNGAFYAFLALGFAAVLGLTRALNLAHGELVVLGGYLGYAAAGGLGWPPLAVAPLAALAMVPVGLLWRLLLARVREPIELNSMVLTFGLSLLLQNLMLGTWSADYRVFASEAGAGPPLLPGLSRERAVAGALGLATVGGLHVLLTRTRWGTAVRATSRDAEAAALVGVNVDRVAAASFAVAAALAGAGGVLFAMLHYLHPAAGIPITLLAVTLAILGTGWRRLGRLPGLLAGGLVLGTAESLVLAWAGAPWRELVVAGLLLTVLAARGRGHGDGDGHP